MAETLEGLGNTVADENARGFKAAGLLGRRGLLMVLSGPRLGRGQVVASAPVIAGRQAGCDLVVEDPLLSRQHFRVSPLGPSGDPREGEFLLEDLDSKNSTYLNAKQLAGAARLHYGDRIVAGGTVFRFLLEEEAEKKGGKPHPPGAGG
jgi:pSer/pThr/pTyr-binding forkhead associated (FHA) protein